MSDLKWSILTICKTGEVIHHETMDVGIGGLPSALSLYQECYINYASDGDTALFVNQYGEIHHKRIAVQMKLV